MVSTNSYKWFILKSLSFLVLFTLPGACLAELGDSLSIKLSLAVKGQQITMTIENTSNGYVKINKVFSMDPVVGVIHFEIKENGLKRELQASINASPLNEKSYIGLRPRNFYGTTLDLPLVEQMYGVSGRCYNLRVYYFDRNAHEFNAFDKKVYSRELRVCHEKALKKS